MKGQRNGSDSEMRWLTADLVLPAGKAGSLRETLQAALRETSGLSRRILALERRPSAYRSSAALELLSVTLDDGERLDLIFKDLGAHALSRAARRAKPPFLRDPLREIAVYRYILARSPPVAPRLYGTVVDPVCGRYWLFIEHIRGRELYQVGEHRTWHAVARWLARMHARFARRNDLAELADTGRLLRFDGDFYRLWPHRAQRLVRLSKPARQPAVYERLDRVVERYDTVQEHLLALPATLIHGEFYASNVLVEDTAAGPRVCPVDWEMAALGPGLLDLVALTSGGWSEDERVDLALAYLEGLVAAGGPAPTAEQLLDALAWCRLHVAMQWLGWSAEWQPPPDHAHDWLSEALHVAGRLGL